MSEARYQFQVTVQPRYLPEQSDPSAGQYAFAYTVRITNAGSVAAQVVSRHWIITDGHGQIREVKGLGVVGHQPLLAPGQSFEYTSGSQMPTPAGTMHGSYQMQLPSGDELDVRIAPFVLAVPHSLN